MHGIIFCEKSEVFINNFQFMCGANFIAFGKIYVFQPKAGWSDFKVTFPDFGD